MKNSIRLTRCLNEAGIQPESIHMLLSRSIKTLPKHKNLRDAIKYKVAVIHAERLLLLLTP